MLCNSLLEVAENANQTFWLNGKRPKLPNKSKWSIQFWLKVWLLAWQSRNGNDNFLTCNSKFRSDQTDRKWTTLTTGSPTTYFVNSHTFSYKLEVRRTPTEFGQPVLWPENFHTEVKHSIYFSTEISKTFDKMERTLRVDQKKRGLETVIIGNGYCSYAYGRFHCS